MDNKKKLDKIAKKTLYGSGVNSNMVKYSFEVFKRHILGKEILELGPAEGIMTDLLVSLDINLTVVEGAKVFCDSLTLDTISFCVIDRPSSAFVSFLKDNAFSRVFGLLFGRSLCSIASSSNRSKVFEYLSINLYSALEVNIL